MNFDWIFRMGSSKSHYKCHLTLSNLRRYQMYPGFHLVSPFRSIWFFSSSVLKLLLSTNISYWEFPWTISMIKLMNSTGTSSNWNSTMHIQYLSWHLQMQSTQFRNQKSKTIFSFNIFQTNEISMAINFSLLDKYSSLWENIYSTIQR